MKNTKIRKRILSITAASILIAAGLIAGTDAQAARTAFYLAQNSDQSSETVIRIGKAAEAAMETVENVTQDEGMEERTADANETTERNEENPTTNPTVNPTTAPTSAPTFVPTKTPTAAPTAAPTSAPTTAPTAAPTAVPTAVPTAAPTAVPTAVPTAAPTAAPVHTHSYVSTVTTPATCTTNGTRTYTCSCGDSYTESIPATGHAYVQTSAVAATCATNGSITYTCTNCGGTKQETLLATGAHTWVPVTQDVWIVDQAAWDEVVTDYIYEIHDICNICGLDFTNAGYSLDDLDSHTLAHVLAFEGGGWHTAQVAVPITTTLHHDEVGHMETQTLGYVCSVCGATQ